MVVVASLGIYPIVSESLAEAGIRLDFQERPCDGFNPFVGAVNQPIGRPRRNLVGPRNPFINAGALVVTDAILSRLSDAQIERYIREEAEIA